MNIDIYTGHYTQIVEKKSTGSAFTSTLKQGTEFECNFIKLFGKEDTYQSIQIKGCVSTFEKLLNKLKGKNVPHLSFTVHSQHNHTSRLISKVENIFNDIRKYNTIHPSSIDEWKKVVEMKMRKSNRAFYNVHDQLVELTLLLLQFHFEFGWGFTVETVQTFPNHPEMRTAIQFAEIHLEESLTKSEERSNVIELRRVGS